MNFKAITSALLIVGSCTNLSFSNDDYYGEMKVARDPQSEATKYNFRKLLDDLSQSSE